GGTLYVVTWDIPNSKSTVQWATLDGGGFVREGVHDAGSNVTQFQTAAIANQLVVSFNEFGCVPSVFIASGALSSELGAGFTPACSTLPIVEFAGAPWAFDPASGALLRWNGTAWVNASPRVDALTITGSDAVEMAGEVYVAFTVGLGDGGTDLRVSRFDGGTWEGLGDAGLRVNGQPQGVTIAAEAGGIYVSFVEPASGTVVRSIGYVKTWNGTGWTAVGGDLALGNGIDVVEVEAVMVDGNPFVGVRQKSELYVLQLSGGAWAKVFGADVSASNKLDYGPRLAFDGRDLYVVEREGSTGPWYVREGTVSDGGSLVGTDGGSGSDAGSAADGGTGDAGSPADGGVIPTDAGTLPDGGALTTDAGTLPDGGESGDDGGLPDADGGTGPRDPLNLPVGCDCNAAPSSLLIVGALLTMATARKRRRPHP
ncbi:MAG: hypothetical protein ACJ790_17910, partial [Myxococcaceae bacterium]